MSRRGLDPIEVLILLTAAIMLAALMVLAAVVAVSS